MSNQNIRLSFKCGHVETWTFVSGVEAMEEAGSTLGRLCGICTHEYDQVRKDHLESQMDGIKDQLAMLRESWTVNGSSGYQDEIAKLEDELAFLQSEYESYSN